MNICEHKNIRCAYCGESNKLKENYSSDYYRLHEVVCLICGGLFFIPCED